MAVQKFLSLVNGLVKEAAAIVTSSGASDAGKIVALDAAGKLDATVMPSSAGTAVITALAMDALSAGDFVTIINNGGTICMN